jgi:thiamine pyrophosphokinase
MRHADVVAVKALLVAGGDVPTAARLPRGTLADAGLVIAADGGAARCVDLGLRPDLVVGDLDSASPALVERLAADGIPVERVPAEKDESDLELALLAAIDRGADSVIILGALGGPRVEHAIAALDLLVVASERGVAAAIVDDRSTIRLLRGRREAGAPGLQIDGAPGDFVSLFAWGGDAAGVSTDGLRYPLRDEALAMGPSRGLSNELLGPAGMVRCRAGDLLVVHTRRAAVSAAAGHVNEGGRG